MNHLDSCKICPRNLTINQHTRFHNPILYLQSLISKQLKYHPYHSKPTSKGYRYKLKEIAILHKLGFCMTENEFDNIYRQLTQLILEIQSLIKRKTAVRPPLRI